MAQRIVQYPGKFRAQRPPDRPAPVFAEQFPRNPVPRRIALSVVATTALASAWVPPADPIPGPASTIIVSIGANPIASFPIAGARIADATVTGVFGWWGQDAPNIAKRTAAAAMATSSGVGFVVPPTVPRVLFGGAEAVRISPRLAGPLLSTAAGFVVPPPAQFLQSWAEQQRVITPRINVTLTDLPAEAFISPPVTPTFTALSFSESPTRSIPLRALLPFNDIAFLQIAYTPSALSFSESPTRTIPPRPLLTPERDISFVQIAYTPSVDWTFTASPELLKAPFNLKQFADISFLQIAYTPGPLFSFAAQPERIIPAKALKQFSDIAFLQIAYTPSALTFSESPTRTIQPRAQVLPDLGVTVTQVAATPSALTFSESPTKTIPDRPLLTPPADISFLQIAYTPSAWGFSPSPELFKQPVKDWSSAPFQYPAFQAVAVGNTAWASESPVLFGRPHPLLTPDRGISFLQISYTSGPLVFSESPTRIIPPRPLLTPERDIAFLQIAYTPGPLSFAEWPSPRQIMARIVQAESGADAFSRTPFFQPYVFTDAQIAAIRARMPVSDAYPFGATFAAQTPSALSFSESPIRVIPARPLLTPERGIAFLQIAYTPSALSFADAQIVGRRTRLILPDGYPFGAVFAAQTPSALVFSESPTRIIAARPLLTPERGIAFLQIAYTPSNFWFGAQPEAFKKPWRIQQDTFLFTPPLARFDFGNPLDVRVPIVKGPRDQPSFVRIPAAQTPITLAYQMPPDPRFKLRFVDRGSPPFQVPTVQQVAVHRFGYFSQEPGPRLRHRFPFYTLWPAWAPNVPPPIPPPVVVVVPPPTQGVAGSGYGSRTRGYPLAMSRADFERLISQLPIEEQSQMRIELENTEIEWILLNIEDFDA